MLKRTQECIYYVLKNCNKDKILYEIQNKCTIIKFTALNGYIIIREQKHDFFPLKSELYFFSFLNQTFSGSNIFYLKDRENINISFLLDFKSHMQHPFQDCTCNNPLYSIIHKTRKCGCIQRTKISESTRDFYRYLIALFQWNNGHCAISM